MMMRPRTGLCGWQEIEVQHAGDSYSFRKQAEQYLSGVCLCWLLFVELPSQRHIKRPRTSGMGAAVHSCAREMYSRSLTSSNFSA